MEGCGPNCKYKHEPEVWRDCKESKNHEVSNHGRVRNKHNKRIARSNGQSSYSRVRLATGSGTYQFRNHRLVAAAFLRPTDKNQIFVNHINGIRKDNHVWNLEYATPSQNSRHAHATGLVKRTGREILQINKTTGELINEFKSIVEAVRKNPRFTRDTLYNALNGRQKYGYNYLWRYKEDIRKTRQIDYESTFTSGERWKSLPGHENVEISDRGRARNMKTERLYKIEEDENGYIRFRHKMMHVLVAQLFIENDDPQNKTVVDHIDSNKRNNDYRNLRWCTPKQNTQYALGKRVLQCNPIDGTVIREFATVTEAAKAIGIASTSISACALGRPRYKTAGGHAWKYA